jgi:hypothetical protein
MTRPLYLAIAIALLIALALLPLRFCDRHLDCGYVPCLDRCARPGDVDLWEVP